MNRKDFIKTCGFACFSSLTVGSIFQSCTSMKMVNGKIEGANIVIDASEFNRSTEQEISYVKYIIVQNAQLQFPICVYRINENEYSALLMRCSHQGNELTAYGDKLHCSAHGSEFDKYGKVTSGPASSQLRKFSAIKENEKIKISIKSL